MVRNLHKLDGVRPHQIVVEAISRYRKRITRIDEGCTEGLVVLGHHLEDMSIGEHNLQMQQPLDEKTATLDVERVTKHAHSRSDNIKRHKQIHGGFASNGVGQSEK
jgi:hypothetical protein